MVPGRLSWSKSDFDSWQKSFEVTMLGEMSTVFAWQKDQLTLLGLGTVGAQPPINRAQWFRTRRMRCSLVTCH